MRISFVLPSRSPVPIGGFRVVYELANRLVGHGHEVAVIHPRTPASPASLVARLKARLWVFRYRYDPASLAPWFALDPRVRMLAISHLHASALPATDALVATTWETAICVDTAAPEGVGFYLIQGYDVWFAGTEEVRETWRLPLHKIVISGWLEEIATELGETCRTSRMTIGLDLDEWGVDLPPERREVRIGALLNPKKGEADVLAALALARESVPGLIADTFGTGPPPAGLPAWIEYSRLPDAAALRRLYNSCSLFVQASGEEGWGLPAIESMACGCALVTYDNGGSREYAFDGETARVVEDRGADHLAAAILELLADDELRLALVGRGRDLVHGFTWERSVEAFEVALTR
jgi:glycosyltransferase involved in cell wall biosynthesis